MMGSGKLVTLGGDEPLGAETELVGDEFAPPAEYVLEDEIFADEAPRSYGWILPAAAVMLVAAWSAFFFWANGGDIARGGTPAQWSGWIADWCVPVVLIVGLWLLAMRHSTREANRFGDAARLLSSESAALESRLSTVNRELSLARDFIAAQSRDLESLGRVASDRLSENAERLQSLIRDNGEQVERIGSVSDSALVNMDRLRDQLPVISNAARDVTSQIGHSGETAQAQLEELVAAFDRLNQAEEAGQAQVDALREQVEATLAGFAQRTADLDRLTQERFGALRDQSEAFRVELEARETDTLAAIRRRADTLESELGSRSSAMTEREAAALSDLQARFAALSEEGARVAETLHASHEEARVSWEAALDALEGRMRERMAALAESDETAEAAARERIGLLQAEVKRIDASLHESGHSLVSSLDRRAAELRKVEKAHLEDLEARLAAFDERVSERQEDHLAHIAGLTERGEALGERLHALDMDMERLGEKSSLTRENVAASAGTLAAKLAESQAVLERSGETIGVLTSDSVRLLELIRSSAEHAHTDLVKSIGVAEERLAAFETHAVNLSATIGEAQARGETLAGHVQRAQEGGTESIETLAALEERLAGVAQRSDEVARHARTELSEAIAELQKASEGALDTLRSGQAETVRELGERIGAEGSDAIKAALHDSAGSAIADLDQAARDAAESGRQTAIQLRDQLSRVNELVGNLETRVAQARERAEESVDGNFARRMALISEALNSSAIDIAKVFDTEVSDTAWASYLRGDRGIFTRRAVRLLDNGEARSIAEVYEEDADVRENVNRYIHDFEAMLRTVLSTRDGNTMAVTLLGSDAGKLYVALAQAIERLRA